MGGPTRNPSILETSLSQFFCGLEWCRDLCRGNASAQTAASTTDRGLNVVTTSSTSSSSVGMLAAAVFPLHSSSRNTLWNSCAIPPSIACTVVKCDCHRGIGCMVEITSEPCMMATRLRNATGRRGRHEARPPLPVALHLSHSSRSRPPLEGGGRCHAMTSSVEGGKRCCVAPWSLALSRPAVLLD